MQIAKLGIVVLAAFAIGCVKEGTLERSSVKEEIRAAEAAQTVLDKVIFSNEVKSVYDDAHDSFRETVAYPDLERKLAAVRERYPQSRIDINGYEKFPDESRISIYARSTAGPKPIYYRLSFATGDAQSPRLSALSLSDSEYPRTSRYAAYETPFTLIAE